MGVPTLNSASRSHWATPRCFEYLSGPNKRPIGFTNRVAIAALATGEKTFSAFVSPQRSAQIKLKTNSVIDALQVDPFRFSNDFNQKVNRTILNIRSMTAALGGFPWLGMMIAHLIDQTPGPQHEMIISGVFSVVTLMAGATIRNKTIWNMIRQHEIETKSAELEKRTAQLQERTAAFGMKSQQLETLINSMPDYIYVKGMRGEFITVNTFMAESMAGKGTTPESLIGKTDFDYYPEDLARQYNADDTAVLTTGVPVIGREEPAVDRNGISRWMLTTKMPLRDCTGKIIGLAGIGKDITVLKREEAERLKTESSRAMIGLIDSFSHYVETGALKVDSYSANLEDETAASQAYEQVEAALFELGMIKDGGDLHQRLHAVRHSQIASLRNYSTLLTKASRSMAADVSDIIILAGSGTREKQDVPIKNLLNEIREGSRKFSADNNCTIMVETSGITPDHCVNISRVELQRAITAIVNNAILSYSNNPPKDGTPRNVSIKASTDGDLLVLSVSDNGRGVPENIRTRLFREKVESSAGRAGSELFYISGILQRAGGTIAYEPVQPSGSVFTVRLPIKVVQKTAAAIEHPTEVMLDAEDLKANGIRAIVIDDDEPIRGLNARILEKLGFPQILQFADAQAAMASCSDEVPTVAIVDKQLPGMSGIDFIRRMSETHPKFRFILLSGTIADDPNVRRLTNELPVIAIQKADGKLKLNQEVKRMAASIITGQLPKKVVLKPEVPSVNSGIREEMRAFLSAVAHDINGRFQVFISEAEFIETNNGIATDEDARFLTEARNRFCDDIDTLQEFCSTKGQSLRGFNSRTTDMLDAVPAEDRPKLAVLVHFYLKHGLLEYRKFLEACCSDQQLKQPLSLVTTQSLTGKRFNIIHSFAQQNVPPEFRHYASILDTIKI